MIRRLTDYRLTFGDEDPTVWILAPSSERPIPAGDTRRGTAWIFRREGDARSFGEWLRDRHHLEAEPLAVKMRVLAARLADRDLTWILDPQPRAGHAGVVSFKAPLPH